MGSRVGEGAQPPSKTGSLVIPKRSRIPLLITATITALGFNMIGRPFDTHSPFFPYFWFAAVACVGVGSWAAVRKRRRWQKRGVRVSRTDGGAIEEISASRVYAISDLHTDVPLNHTWLSEYAAECDATGRHTDDLIIVAGDISDRLDVIRSTLLLLTRTFGAGVAFVPGNHDLWCGLSSGGNSMDKYQDIMAICKELGVFTKPFAVVPTAAEGGDDHAHAHNFFHHDGHSSDEDENSRPLLVVPLLSWYHSSWDTEPDIPGLPLPPVRLAATDFRRCKWPLPLDPLTDDVAHHFDRMNNGVVDVAMAAYPTARILSFSHFLPFQQLIPEKRMLYYPHLPKMVGSTPLRERVRRLRPECHIFGHTHFAWDSKIEGMRFIQAPVGYPSERTMAGGPGWRPFLVVDHGDFVSYPQPCRWSDYYRENVRDSSNFDLAPWVKDKWNVA
eukprot:m.133587 g.133587  ORF g.133587 m.133587 type:complete len:444 (+) comp11360_c1_seq2:247-1578(+)